MTILTTPPQVPVAAGWRFPARTESHLDNGMRVLTYSCPGQYVVSASLVFDVPLNVEPPALEGIAGLTGRCLILGAGGHSAEEQADALALCGADLEAGANAFGFAIGLAVPASRLDEGLRLMASATTSPTFDPTEFEQERRRLVQEIEQAQAYPNHVAGEQLYAAIFAPHDRASRPASGRVETVQGSTVADVASYADQHLQPSNATMIIAGEFTDTNVVAMVSDAFGGWAHVGGPVLAGEVPTLQRTPRVILVDWKDSPQATLRVAGPAIDRGDERWPAMFVAHYAVGGHFSSRINRVLREKKGVTYGANSTIDAGRDRGVMIVSTAVRSDATAESVGDIASILAEARGTISDDEVATGIRAAAESAALGFERADAVVARVEMLLSQRLPLDHVDTNLERIRQVTTKAANTAYSEIVDPDALTVVVIGDADELRPGLEAWGYGLLTDAAQP